jgi:predicted nucleic acid-binding protein
VTLIVDTTVWIEFFRGKLDYHQRLLPLIEAGQVLALQCVFGELLQGARTERERAVIERFWQALPEAEVPGLFLLAGRLASIERYAQKGVGVIDATIVASARRLKARVWSLDRKLNAVLLEGEKYLPPT